MAKHIYHIAHMIVNHRHIQNYFNVLGLIFHKCRFLHSEQKFCVVSKSTVKPSTFQCSYHIYRPFDRFTIKKSWKCTFKRMSFLMKLEVINRQLHLKRDSFTGVFPSIFYCKLMVWFWAIETLTYVFSKH